MLLLSMTWYILVAWRTTIWAFFNSRTLDENWYSDHSLHARYQHCSVEYYIHYSDVRIPLQNILPKCFATDILPHGNANTVSIQVGILSIKYIFYAFTR